MKSLLIIILLLPVYLFSQNELPDSEEMLASIKNHKASAVSITIFKNFSKDTTLLFGRSNINTGNKITEESLFNIGTMSASFAHLLILKMEENGIINSINDPVNKYLTSWKIPESRFTKKAPVTIADLMLHRRGFKPISKPTGYRPSNDLPPVMDLLKIGTRENPKPVRLNSNSNKSGNSSYYNDLILQYMIECIYGVAYQEVITREIIIPLGLKNTYCMRRPIQSLIEDMVTGYDILGNQIPENFPAFVATASSGIWSTTEDFARYVNHLFKAYHGQIKNSIVSHERIVQGLTDQYSDYRRMILLHKHGYYWGGASMGYRTQFGGDIDQGNIAVIFVNSHENWRFMHEIQDRVWAYINNSPEEITK